MTLILTLGALVLIALVGFLWRDQVKHRRRVAAQPPMKHTRCGTFDLERGGTITMGFGPIVEEHTLDENGVLQVRVLTEET